MALDLDIKDKETLQELILLPKTMKWSSTKRMGKYHLPCSFPFLSPPPAHLSKCLLYEKMFSQALCHVPRRKVNKNVEKN